MDALTADKREVETEVQGGFAIGFPAGFPITAQLQGQLTRRYRARADDFTSQITAPPETLQRRLEGSERLDALLVAAAQAAAVTADQGKRRLLGRLINQAVLDDAETDNAELMVGILRQIDGPHVRALEAIRRAELAAEEAGEVEPVAEGAERPIVPRIEEAGRRQPHPVRRLLDSLGLVDSAATYGGGPLITGTSQFGRELLDDLRAAGREDANSGQ